MRTQIKMDSNYYWSCIAISALIVPLLVNHVLHLPERPMSYVLVGGVIGLTMLWRWPFVPKTGFKRWQWGLMLVVQVGTLFI